MHESLNSLQLGRQDRQVVTFGHWSQPDGHGRHTCRPCSVACRCREDEHIEQDRPGAEQAHSRQPKGQRSEFLVPFASKDTRLRQGRGKAWHFRLLRQQPGGHCWHEPLLHWQQPLTSQQPCSHCICSQALPFPASSYPSRQAWHLCVPFTLLQSAQLSIWHCTQVSSSRYQFYWHTSRQLAPTTSKPSSHSRQVPSSSQSRHPWPHQFRHCVPLLASTVPSVHSRHTQLMHCRQQATEQLVSYVPLPPACQSGSYYRGSGWAGSWDERTANRNRPANRAIRIDQYQWSGCSGVGYQQQKSVMNILEGVKPSSSKTCNSAKFIIKSKPSAKEPRPEPDPETAYSTNQDVHQLLTYMANKSRRLGELLEAKGIQDSADFFTSSLYDNPCIRTLLKAIMDRLLAERRLGKNLKGINRGILTEIENLIWQSLEREVALYQLNKLYQKEKSGLEQELQARRREIQGQIQALQAEGGRKCLSETNLIIEDSF